MDPDFQMQYSGLLVHHLERHELEYELSIRAVQYEAKDTQAALRRRLRDRLKEEDANAPDVDFTRCERSIDEEIKLIDHNVFAIRQFLENKIEFDGIKESLKTRLVHYFARCSRIQRDSDEDNDLEDLDRLKGTIRELMNNHFSPFSANPAVRTEIINEIARTLSNMSISQNSKTSKRKSASGRGLGEASSEGNPVEPSVAGSRRQLKSITALGSNCSIAEEERVLRRFRLDAYNNNANDSEETSGDSDRSSSESSDDDPRPRKSKAKRSRKVVRKSRPVSEWNIRYDGKDNGQGLMRFIRETEFLARSENISKRELYRSAIYLFQGPAKIWFMAGVENEEFESWDELVREMKKEFLSPDHDHVSEIRAISRKQGSKEKFQDYLQEMQKIFNSLTKPITEGKKFEIVFRNMRSDYKGHAVASNIDNLADLKQFGRKLDATFWYKYNTVTEETTRNRANVSEVHTGTRPKSKPETDRKFIKTRNFYRSAKTDVSEDEKPPKKPRETPKATPESGSKPPKNPDILKVLVDKYRPPIDGTCFNCRLEGHHQKECDRPRHKFCGRCGFLNVDTKNCPYCAKNAQ